MITAPRVTLRVAGILAMFFAVLAVALRAQDRQPPVIRTTTRLVQLNVVVLDNHRRPVSDLATSGRLKLFVATHRRKCIHGS